MHRFYPFQMRTIPEPTVQLPVACRSVGHYRVSPTWDNAGGKVKHFVELFWGIRGSGVFRIDGKDEVLNPGDALVLYPGDQHHITAAGRWEYRWMTLDGEMPGEVARAFGFQRAPTPVGHCPEQLFERLACEIEDISPQGQRAASATAYEILTLAFGQMKEAQNGTRQVRQCIDLIREHYGSADLNVTTLAERVGVHRTNLSKLFRDRMRISPIGYLTSFRVARALELLRKSDQAIGNIARQTGFARTNYFTRVIRQHTGLSPREIRRQWWS